MQKDRARALLPLVNSPQWEALVGYLQEQIQTTQQAAVAGTSELEVFRSLGRLDFQLTLLRLKDKVKATLNAS